MTTEPNTCAHTNTEGDSTQDNTQKSDEDHYIIQSGCVMVIYDRFIILYPSTMNPYFMI